MKFGGKPFGKRSRPAVPVVANKVDVMVVREMRETTALREAKARGATIVLVASSKLDISENSLAGIDVVVVAEPLVRAITGEDGDAFALAQALVDKAGATSAVVTLSQPGCLHYGRVTSEAPQFFGIKSPEGTVPTSKLHDVFADALVKGIAEGMHPLEASRHALREASQTRAISPLVL